MKQEPWLCRIGTSFYCNAARGEQTVLVSKQWPQVPNWVLLKHMCVTDSLQQWGVSCQGILFRVQTVQELNVQFSGDTESTASIDD